MFTAYSDHHVNLRSSNEIDYKVPKPKTELFKGSLSYSGSKLWNSIPTNIRQSATIKSFTHNYTKLLNNG